MADTDSDFEDWTDENLTPLQDAAAVDTSAFNTLVAG